MAARKSALRPAPPRPELEKLLEEARKQGASDEELQEQRASFAFGNASASTTGITKETAREASRRNRLTSVA